MTKKKGGFLTFCFSLIPGAGEMYMGFMKQGLSIMAVFWGVIFIASCLNVGPVLFILPILWCYSFFNVHNLKGMPDEEFYAMEDDYVFHLDKIIPLKKWSKKQNNILAGILILIGGTVLWNNFVSYLYELLPNTWNHWQFINDIPQIIIAVILIGVGVSLIRGKKASLGEGEQKEKKEEIS